VNIVDRLRSVRARIEAASDGRSVRIVAVTKGLGAEAVVAAVNAGVLDVGENYAQDLLAKAAHAPAGVRWHFLGAVQTNKVARLAPHVAVWHAIDRVRAGDAIARRAPAAAVFVQVNVTGEARKAGCRPHEAAGLVADLRERKLDVRGLMTVGPEGDPRGARRAFEAVADLGRRLGTDELSMGMSDDFEEAVRAGATTVRLGRVLFGSRPGAAGVGR
jgi:PLP dependent protein